MAAKTPGGPEGLQAERARAAAFTYYSAPETYTGAMKRILAILALSALTAAPAALAQQGGNPWANQFSPGQAREAVREGKTVPLNRIFQQLKREYGGYQLGAELYSRDDGTTFYEIDWMTEDGRKAHFTVDAQSGSVINRRGG